MASDEFWSGKRVLVTGHTGFCGGWLVLWLADAGAHLCGYSLPPEDDASLYAQVRLGDLLQSHIGDLRDVHQLNDVVDRFNPEIIFHLAAQSLVRRSYMQPVETYSTNVMGTLNMLEAARRCDSVKAFVNITSDKCYLNAETGESFTENDRLGGNDPYSSSKACVEIMSQAYRASYFQNRTSAHKVALATVRAGNIIGGGDWARDRIIPDLIRGVERGSTVSIRNPEAVRPWQHALDAIAGYLRIGECLCRESGAFAEAWNIGPDPASRHTVRDIVTALSARFGDRLRYVLMAPEDGFPEAKRLHLDTAKARGRLGWRQELSFEESVQWTLEWYDAYLQGAAMRDVSMEQIDRFRNNHAGQHRLLAH